jgi:hypothetical protein
MSYEENSMEEESFVPLNWDNLIQNPEVWMEIKRHLPMMEAECLMAIITKAKEQNLRDEQIFLPVEAEYENLSSSPFEDSTED